MFPDSPSPPPLSHALSIYLSFVVFTCNLAMHPSFEGPDWGFKSTGAQRAACLRAMGKAIEDDKDVSKTVNTNVFS